MTFRIISWIESGHLLFFLCFASTPGLRRDSMHIPFVICRLSCWSGWLTTDMAGNGQACLMRVWGHSEPFQCFVWGHDSLFVIWLEACRSKRQTHFFFGSVLHGCKHIIFALFHTSCSLEFASLFALGIFGGATVLLSTRNPTCWSVRCHVNVQLEGSGLDFQFILDQQMNNQ